MPVERRGPDGTIRTTLVWLVDWERPERNDWLVARQFTVVEQHKHRRLSVAEAAFYDAIAANESAVLTMGDETLKQISIDLVSTVQQSATIDWNLKDSVKAAMRAKVRRLLARYDYPPDLEDAAVELVLEQAEQYALAA